MTTPPSGGVVMFTGNITPSVCRRISSQASHGSTRYEASDRRGQPDAAATGEGRHARVMDRIGYPYGHRGTGLGTATSLRSASAGSGERHALQTRQGAVGRAPTPNQGKYRFHVTRRMRVVMVRMGRLELPRPKAPEPKSGVSTNSTTSAGLGRRPHFTDLPAQVNHQWPALDQRL